MKPAELVRAAYARRAVRWANQPHPIAAAFVINMPFIRVMWSLPKMRIYKPKKRSKKGAA